MRTITKRFKQLLGTMTAHEVQNLKTIRKKNFDIEKRVSNGILQNSNTAI